MRLKQWNNKCIIANGWKNQKFAILAFLDFLGKIAIPSLFRDHYLFHDGEKLIRLSVHFLFSLQVFLLSAGFPCFASPIFGSLSWLIWFANRHYQPSVSEIGFANHEKPSISFLKFISATARNFHPHLALGKSCPNHQVVLSCDSRVIRSFFQNLLIYFILGIRNLSILLSVIETTNRMRCFSLYFNMSSW